MAGARVERHVFELRADATGTVPSGAVSYFEGVLVAIATYPGLPAPTASFDVVLLDPAGRDGLEGCGRRRSPVTAQRAIVRVPKKGRGPDRHPLLNRYTALRLTIVGAIAPRAVVHVHLFVAVDEGEI